MDAFAAIADKVRRDLLVSVAIRPMRVVDLAAQQTISRPAVSKHLRLLTEAGLVDVEERGRERYYALRPQPLGEVRAFLQKVTPASATSALASGALDALDTEVRRTTRERRRRTRRTSTPHEETA
jgi:DNA-binding transcriptional ArsR family regulator